MNKKIFFFICIFFGLSLVIFIVSKSFVNGKTEALDVEKTNYQNLKGSIKTLKEEEMMNRNLINKTQKDPNILGVEAKKNSEEFLNKLNKFQNQADEDKQENYPKIFKHLATSNVYKDEELYNVEVPEKYELYIGTSRASNIEVLVKNKEKGNYYLILSYNTANKKITSIEQQETR